MTSGEFLSGSQDQPEHYADKAKLLHELHMNAARHLTDFEIRSSWLQDFDGPALSIDIERSETNYYVGGAISKAPVSAQQASLHADAVEPVPDSVELRIHDHTGLQGSNVYEFLFLDNGKQATAYRPSKISEPNVRGDMLLTHELLVALTGFVSRSRTKYNEIPVATEECILTELRKIDTQLLGVGDQEEIDVAAARAALTDVAKQTIPTGKAVGQFVNRTKQAAIVIAHHPYARISEEFALEMRQMDGAVGELDQMTVAQYTLYTVDGILCLDIVGTGNALFTNIQNPDDEELFERRAGNPTSSGRPATLEEIRLFSQVVSDTLSPNSFYG